MAIDKVVDSTQLDQDLTSVANAIRTRGETSAQLTFPSGFVSAINAIPSGGAPEKKDVNFYDYEGTLLYSYTAAEFADLQAMPDNPTHEGLTAQGWNWTLQEAKTYVAAYGRLIIGQTYITSDGATRIYVDLVDGATSPFLGLTVNGTVTIDWGDGSATDTVTGTKSVGNTPEYTQHQYAAVGSYVISITPSTGTKFWLKNKTSHGYILSCKSSSDINLARGYLACIKKIFVGEGVAFDASSNNTPLCSMPNLEEVIIPYSSGITTLYQTFNNDYSLKWVNIPKSVTRVYEAYTWNYCLELRGLSLPPTITDFDKNKGYNFSYCYKLEEVTLPTGITKMSWYMFDNCQSLTSVVLPLISGLDTGDSSFMSLFNNCKNLKSVVFAPTQTGLTQNNTSNMFSNCTNLEDVSLPQMTGLGQTMFQSCASLRKITIPTNVTVISPRVFYGCNAIDKVTIPVNVTDIGAGAFYNCTGVREYHLLPTTPPTLGSSDVFYSIASDCVIYVPQGSLEAYQTATNWSTHASKMQEEPS